MSWEDELRSSFRHLGDLSEFMDRPLPKTSYPVFVPRKLAEKIKNLGPESALWHQFIPQGEEDLPEGLMDPIADQKFQVTANLIHRYANRALFIPTTRCPVQCRYCFRKNELHENTVFGAEFEKSMAYLKENQIEEVILTGGDPLMLSNQKLKNLLRELSEIPSLRFVRFHTRFLTILPSRFDHDFFQVLKESKEFFNLIFVFHLNHSDEIDRDTKSVLNHFLESSFHQLFYQSVLLKGVNDHPQTLSNLFRDCSELGLNPHYLHHPDNVKGAQHFKLSLDKSREIFRAVRSITPGWMLPKHVIDPSDGSGKTNT